MGYDSQDKGNNPVNSYPFNKSINVATFRIMTCDRFGRVCIIWGVPRTLSCFNLDITLEFAVPLSTTPRQG